MKQFTYSKPAKVKRTIAEISLPHYKLIKASLVGNSPRWLEKAIYNSLELLFPVLDSKGIQEIIEAIRAGNSEDGVVYIEKEISTGAFFTISDDTYECLELLIKKHHKGDTHRYIYAARELLATEPGSPFSLLSAEEAIRNSTLYAIALREKEAEL